MKHSGKQNHRQGSIQRRLQTYFLTVGLLSILLSLTVMAASARLLSAYSGHVSDMTAFHNFTRGVEDAENTAAYYLQTQSSAYAETFLTQIDSARNDLALLEDRIDTPVLQREFQDLGEICGTLSAEISVFQKDLDDYRAKGGQYSAVLNDYARITNAFGAAESRYDFIRGKILDNITVQTRSVRFQSRIFLISFLLLAGIILILMITQIRRISRSVTDPIQKLTQTAELIRENGMQSSLLPVVPPSPDADREIAALTTVFNDMLEKMRNLFDTLLENARIRQELHESRFRELQMQINPHFLFNTLNMAAETAYLDGSDETAEILEKAASMFRYSLDFSGKSVRLSREIEELGNYVYIQERRFGSRIRFVFDLDEAHHDVLIPALTLQPLVENAIIHGIGIRTQSGKIDIRTSFEKDRSCVGILVRDNGAGMTAEQLREVCRQMEYYRGGSVKIGLGNVFLRLSYFYHGAARMTIDSQSGKGTSVRIEIPCRPEAAIRKQ